MTAHPPTTTHLIVLALFPHAQITPVCPLTFVSCSRMHLLLWLLWFIATFEEEGESLAAPIASTAHLLTTMHLVALVPLSYAQITPVCPLTFVSCSSMHLLVWLWWSELATFEEEGELAAPSQKFCLRLVHVRLCSPKLDLTDSNNARHFTFGFRQSIPKTESYIYFILLDMLEKNRHVHEAEQTLHRRLCITEE
jgi:hypothetical protein